MEFLAAAEAVPKGEFWLVSLITLTVLEVVLGIDNVIFISILAGKLPEGQRARARQLGLAVALISRVVLLLSITWVMGLTKPLFTIPAMIAMKEAMEISGRDLILVFGGLFLLFKATYEIHDKLEGDEHAHGADGKKALTFSGVLVQIFLLDVVFSLDSVITAVGMADRLWIMITAVVIAVVFMLVFARAISEFIEKHPTLKILALSFLLLVGFVLVLDGLHQHVPKGYIYFAMGFSVMVEVININMRKKSRRRVQLNQPHLRREESGGAE
jgi:predicted tellurium resistance membrane protein TerC